MSRKRKQTHARLAEEMREKTAKPNQTAVAFCSCLNNELLPLVRQHHPSSQLEVSVQTATRWLHKLGFSPTSTIKGIYIDGHERADVVLTVRCISVSLRFLSLPILRIHF